MCPKLIIITTERGHWRRYGVFIVNFEHNLTPSSNVTIVDFEQANDSCEIKTATKFLNIFLNQPLHFSLVSLIY